MIKNYVFLYIESVAFRVRVTRVSVTRGVLP